MAARLFLGGLVTLLAFVASGPAQTPSDVPRQTFRAATDLIEVVAVVTDDDGGPVADLTRDDFQLDEDGVHQAITQFSHVEILSDASGRQTRVESDVSTNDVHSDRLYVLVLDGLHVDPLRSVLVRRYATRFIEEYMASGDVGAVVTIGSALGEPFTSDKARLLAAVRRFIGSKGGSTAINKLQSAIRGAGDGPPRDPEANVALYTVDPRGTSIGADSLMEMAGVPASARGMRGVTHDVAIEVRRSQGVLRAFAEQTGGLAVVNASDIDRGLERIARANSSYYVLGYASSNQHWDGRYRRIHVAVSRPGVTVTARKGYYALAAAAAPAERPSAATASGTGTAHLREVLAQPLPVAGLGQTPDRFTSPDAKLVAARIRHARRRLGRRRARRCVDRRAPAGARVE